MRRRGSESCFHDYEFSTSFQVNTIRNHALRLCSSAFCTSLIVKLFAELGISFFPDRRNHLTLKYYLKISEEPNHSNYFKIFHSYLEKTYTTYKSLGNRTRSMFASWNIHPSNLFAIKDKIRN